jgi:hypothetical protein
MWFISIRVCEVYAPVLFTQGKLITMKKIQCQSILFELLRSFSTLARTLNLSKAVRELGSTRQTVRRHIYLLEEARGEKLFSVEDRQYRLTAAGRASLQGAEEILSFGEAWLGRSLSHKDRLVSINITGEGPADHFYFLQEHPISTLWQSKSDLLKSALQSWTLAEGQIEHSAFEKIRPYTMIFRRHEQDWLCTEVGQLSVYSDWFGKEWALSTVGRSLSSLPGGGGFPSLLRQPFDAIFINHGLRYDHIVTQITQGRDGDLHLACYDRLLMGARFPDNSFALLSIVHQTKAIDIKGLPENVKKMITQT